MLRNWFVLGSNISETGTGSQQTRETPPATSTSPLGRRVAVWFRRGTLILPAGLKPPTVAIIAKGIALEVPPPGTGLNTATLAAATVAMSLAGICAVMCVLS